MTATILPESFTLQSAHELCRERSGTARLVFLLILTAAALAGCGHHNVAAHPPASTPVPQPGTSSGKAPSPPSGTPPAIERQPAVPGEYVEEGVASWYGIPFNGHRTSNGEIYDMHQFTAAHRTLPFNCIVRVTNLDNGKQTEVRINDRGPFVANRVIDLSLSAAQAIEMVGPGTAHVRLEIVSGPSPQGGFFGVQIGAFKVEENAEKLKAQLETSYSPVSIATYDSPNGTFYRLRVGHVASEDAARQLANQLHSAGQFTTFVVRLDN
ncbi:MAG: septal ring lytic transglycosylase RlpA family protein [Candidatus Acidiferrales bacterium]